MKKKVESSKQSLPASPVTPFKVVEDCINLLSFIGVRLGRDLAENLLLSFCYVGAEMNVTSWHLFYLGHNIVIGKQKMHL